MNRAADEKLRAAVREWLEASPAAGVSLHVGNPGGGPSVFVRVGTVDQLRMVTPAAERNPSVSETRAAALADALEACEKVQDECRERNGGKYPELQESADVGAGDCMAAIRALK